MPTGTGIRPAQQSALRVASHRQGQAEAVSRPVLVTFGGRVVSDRGSGPWPVANPLFSSYSEKKSNDRKKYSINLLEQGSRECMIGA
jgi:hypothetical protein